MAHIYRISRVRPARVVALFALLLVGCDHAILGAGGLTVDLSLSEDVLVPGETLLIDVAATNPGPWRVQFSSGGCVLWVDVLAEDASRVWPGPTVCTDQLIVHDLAPGESLNAQFRFDGRSWRYPEGARRPERYDLPPGRYFVVAGVTPDMTAPSDPAHLEIRR